MSKRKPTPDEEPKKETTSDEESGDEINPGDEPKKETTSDEESRNETNPGGSPDDHPGGSPKDDSGGSPNDHPGGSPSDDSGGSPNDHPGGSPSDDSGGSPNDHPGGSPNGKKSPGNSVIRTVIGATVGAGLAVAVPPLFISMLGFTGAGIAAGSFAAKMMSAAAIANGGGVAAGSTVAVLQSVGAAGFSLATNIGLGTAGAASGAWLFKPKKQT